MAQRKRCRGSTLALPYHNPGAQTMSVLHLLFGLQQPFVEPVSSPLAEDLTGHRMPRIQYKQEIYSFVAGPLGHIEGLTLSLPSSGQSVCHYFGGLPYALPPVGPYRFRRTRPLPDFFRYGTKASPANFTRQTAICPQPKRFKDLDSLWDENCLQLNIYIPASKEAPPAGWPVYFVCFFSWPARSRTHECRPSSIFMEASFSGALLMILQEQLLRC